MADRERRPYAWWATALFGLLLIVDAVPLVRLLPATRGDGAGLQQDSAMSAVVGIGGAAVLAALLGVVGSFRRWHVGALTLLGLVAVSWPICIVWFIVHLPMC
jgi:hypothetical protein